MKEKKGKEKCNVKAAIVEIFIYTFFKNKWDIKD